MKTLGFLVNPIAGMGGSVGLKGTDGLAELAAEKGAVPKAPLRAEEALRELLPIRDELILLCPEGAMGADTAKSLGFTVRTVYEPARRTSAEDTIAAARSMEDADLLLFAGGDGTARDLVRAGVRIPVTGVPAGVKIHSPVYALRPAAAGRLALRFLKSSGLRTKQAEVIDIDEEAWRQNRVRTSLFGYLTVPDGTDLLQHGKASTPASEKSRQADIARDMAERMKPRACYLIGPGSTTAALAERLGIDGTLLGVDLVQDGRLLQKDLSEADILALPGEAEIHLVITPTGGQGYLLGRGNQQLSGAVIRRIDRKNVHVLATPEKLFSLENRPLLVDTGDREADAKLSGYLRAITGYHEEQMVRISGEEE